MDQTRNMNGTENEACNVTINNDDDENNEGTGQYKIINENVPGINGKNDNNPNQTRNMNFNEIKASESTTNNMNDVDNEANEQFRGENQDVKMMKNDKNGILNILNEILNDILNASKNDNDEDNKGNDQYRIENDKNGNNVDQTRNMHVNKNKTSDTTTHNKNDHDNKATEQFKEENRDIKTFENEKNFILNI